MVKGAGIEVQVTLQKKSSKRGSKFHRNWLGSVSTSSTQTQTHAISLRQPRVFESSLVLLRWKAYTAGRSRPDTGDGRA